MVAQPTDTAALRFEANAEKIRTDLSGVAHMPDGTLWVASDETRSVERLTFKDGLYDLHKSFDLATLLGGLSDSKEFDLEGLDQDGDFLWLVGGFGAKRKSENPGDSDAKTIRRFAKVESEPSRCLLARIPLVGGELVASAGKASGAGGPLRAARLGSASGGDPLVDALANDDHLGRFVKAEIPSKDNGLDIEAVTVSGDRIFLGLRGPVLRGWAVLLEVGVEEKSPGILSLKPIGTGDLLYRKYFVDLDGLGVRDLCRDGPDLLILAGPAVMLDGPARIYRLPDFADMRDDALHRPKPVLDLPSGRGDDHPEGMTITASSPGGRSVLIVYDSPSKKRLVSDHEIIADIFDLE